MKGSSGSCDASAFGESAACVGAHTSGASTGGAGPSADSQQALHLFFQQYSVGHADELANSCVLLMCEGMAHGVLQYDAQTKCLCSGWQGGEAQALHLRCKFLLKLLEQTELPTEAIHEAVCANNLHLAMSASAVAAWLQGPSSCYSL